jgi:hypothetical protein
MGPRLRPTLLCLLLTIGPFASESDAIGMTDDWSRARAERSLEEIVQVEHAFAQDSVRNAVKRSFLNYVASDGVIFRPRPVPALETLRADPDDSPSEGFLDWWPVMAGVARSGDLGFSVGPWHQHLASPPANYPADTYGYYCTIWRRQADGSWRFVVDGAGAFLRTTQPSRPRGSPVARLPIPGASRAVGGDGALAEVRAIENHLAVAAGVDARPALSAHYSPSAWVMGSHVEVVPGPTGWIGELTRRPSRLAFRYLGGGASAAGDVVYTYGLAESLDPRMAIRDATYLHIWMRQGRSWQIVFDGIKQRRSFS